jgi:hypothetical protein
MDFIHSNYWKKGDNGTANTRTHTRRDADSRLRNAHRQNEARHRDTNYHQDEQYRDYEGQQDYDDYESGSEDRSIAGDATTRWRRLNSI